MHQRKIRNVDFPLEKTASKNMQMSANDVMSKMADFRLFWPKNRNISSMTHPIMTNDTIIFIPKSLPNQWYHSFVHCRWWKNGCCKGTPFDALPPNNICSNCPMPRLHIARLIKIHSSDTNCQYLGQPRTRFWCFSGVRTELLGVWGIRTAATHSTD